MNNFALPVEFSEISNLNFVQKKSHNEYSASCPQCGGDIHEDGSLPDRFILLLHSTATGGAFGFCRKCGYKWWEGRNGGRELSPEQKRAWIEEQKKIADQARRIAEEKHEKTLAILKREKRWVEYHDILTKDDALRKLWRYRGIPNEYQDLWSFGYCPNFIAWSRDGKGEWEEYKTPTLSIPIFGKSENNELSVLNIRHRLLQPKKPDDKYRPEAKNLGANPWFSDPEVSFDHDNYLVIEGEIKAAVTHILLDDKNLQVIGLPGTKTWELIVDKLRGKRVTIYFDPDATNIAEKFAKELKCKTFSLPVKIDDGINAGIITKSDLLRIIKQARVAA